MMNTDPNFFARTASQLNDIPVFPMQALAVLLWVPLAL